MSGRAPRDLTVSSNTGGLKVKTLRASLNSSSHLSQRGCLSQTSSSNGRVNALRGRSHV